MTYNETVRAAEKNKKGIIMKNFIIIMLLIINAIIWSNL